MKEEQFITKHLCPECGKPSPFIFGLHCKKCQEKFGFDTQCEKCVTYFNAESMYWDKEQQIYLCCNCS